MSTPYTRTTYNRGKLLRLAKAGRLQIRDSYHFDDMLGESRSQGKAIPVAIKWFGRVLPPGVITPGDGGDYRKHRKSGVAYLSVHDFQSHGHARLNPNGTVSLHVHSNCNYTFTILDEKDASGVSADALPKGFEPGKEQAFSLADLDKAIADAHPGLYRDLLVTERNARDARASQAPNPEPAPIAPEPTEAERLAKSLERKAAAEWSRIAGEPVRVEYTKGTLYAFGSELATLRLYKAFHVNGRAGYSDNLKTHYFSLETEFGLPVFAPACA